MLQSVLAIVLTLIVLYALGKITSLVIGRQAFDLFESILERLPVVAKVYTSVRQLLDSMLAKKDSNQRVVLVDFPIAGQKSIGFLTRTMIDSTTGEEVAAVLLPNAINPTSAFLQLIPLSRVTLTDLNMEQAMSMLLTGGAVAPESLVFTQPQRHRLRPPLSPRQRPRSVSLRRVSGFVCRQHLVGMLAFERDLAQADVFKLRPDQSDGNDAQEGDQQQQRSACS